ncbi:MAG: type VI secretion system tip protein VgrG, partial [Calditrichaeota bacterium]
MPEHRFNEPYFELHLSELGPDAVHVFSFEGEEEISRLFEFRLLLLSEDPELDPESILNKPATLVLNVWDQNPVKIHGIISQFEQRGRTPAYVLYSAVLVPRMWRLTLNYQSAVYQNLPLDQVVDHLLREGGFSASDMDFKLNESYPTLEYAVQYRETDFDFINRRLEHFGVFYFFDDDDSKDIIVFGDSNQAFIPVDTAEAIYYDPNRDPLPGVQTINEFNSRARVVTGMIKLKEYNYRYPDRQLLAESQIDGSAPGVYYEFGEHFADDAEGEWLARIRNEEIHCQGLRFRGRSECRLLRPGRTFELAKHYREDWNREYVLLRVRHRGSQSAMFSRMMPHQEFTLTYENEFEALPVDMAYRPPRRTPIPRLPGIMFSRVESAAGDQYAYIDDQGRYHIRLPFDLSDNAQGEASRPVRLNQPYSGPNYGIHFPNHADTEMIWACISGNLDRPIALGTVPNPANMSPSTGNNKQQSVIRTAGQNELTFDDTAGKENIFLHGTK